MRRLAQNLREQNWTAITIEFVLLVAGVFLGIQVANWNGERAEDAKARMYLQRIRANLGSDLATIRIRTAFWRRVIDYGNEAIDYAETRRPPKGTAWSSVLAFYQASQLWPWATRDATYQELKSSGELGLIRNERLRDALGNYYTEGAGQYLDYVFALVPEYRKIVRGQTPSVVSRHIWAKCWSLKRQNEQLLLDCSSPISEAEAQAILDGYLADPQLLSELRFWVANQGVAMDVIANNERDVTAMLAMIDAELKTR